MVLRERNKRDRDTATQRNGGSARDPPTAPPSLRSLPKRLSKGQLREDEKDRYISLGRNHQRCHF
ncbi:hypothetical protein E2C01_029510 [Portunus trituberculatus]|uniref:Uncharacterized protein n=1 Tax=Portunus trituberculatus TaxID=210409 RepID=A0A5B7ET39_PORTR|nr:hypothetical protein [Portunus trituberculatus]